MYIAHESQVIGCPFADIMLACLICYVSQCCILNGKRFHKVGTLVRAEACTQTRKLRWCSDNVQTQKLAAAMPADHLLSAAVHSVSNSS